jgi:hypothetical protein
MACQKFFDPYLYHPVDAIVRAMVYDIQGDQIDQYVKISPKKFFLGKNNTKPFP